MEKPSPFRILHKIKDMKKVLVVIVVGLLGVIGYLMNEQVELQKQYDQLEQDYILLHKIHMHPVANAGTTFKAIWLIGQFHGVIKPQTPIGS